MYTISMRQNPFVLNYQKLVIILYELRELMKLNSNIYIGKNVLMQRIKNVAFISFQNAWHVELLVTK